MLMMSQQTLIDRAPRYWEESTTTQSNDSTHPHPDCAGLKAMSVECMDDSGWSMVVEDSLSGGEAFALTVVSSSSAAAAASDEVGGEGSGDAAGGVSVPAAGDSSVVVVVVVVVVVEVEDDSVSVLAVVAPPAKERRVAVVAAAVLPAIRRDAVKPRSILL